jgi:transcription termination factor Rho
MRNQDDDTPGNNADPKDEESPSHKGQAVMNFDPEDVPDNPMPDKSAREDDEATERPKAQDESGEAGEEPAEGQNKNRRRRKKKPGNTNPQHGNHQNQGGNQQGQGKNKKNNRRPSRGDKKRNKSQAFFARYQNQDSDPVYNAALEWEPAESLEALGNLITEVSDEKKEPVSLDHLYGLDLESLIEAAQKLELELQASQSRIQIIKSLLDHFFADKSPIFATGILEPLEDGNGLLTYQKDSYRLRSLNIFVPKALVDRYGLQHGHEVYCQVHGALPEDSTPIAIKVINVMGMDPDEVAHLPAFTDLVPYYPTQRILMETKNDVDWDNLSMRIVDLITPVGFGQRGLIVAPPRTGKTVLMQGMARAIQVNYPEAHLIILLVDERPEEVTDFRRQVTGEVIASTFDESPESHVHAAEMVIEKSRRMVEAGRDVIIVLDSITRLARAYNTVVPSSGKILTGGVEANALQLPKRFFGSARNIEDGGSLTILGTALVETGSKMDEVIFEEFKGTGNQELHLDRGLVDRRIFPALNMEKSGTRKEELLYHPEEMQKIHLLRRGMKGQPTLDAMETLITRVKKTNTNAEFLMSISR